MRRYDNFSDHDFELFVADLLGTELELRFEAFPRGPDAGVDLRAVPGRRRRPHVVQCKHYARSSFPTLRAAAKKEAARLPALRPQPATYRFVTSQPLTAKRKAAIAAELEPWIRTEADVIGAHDLELLLNKHPAVERRQVKLWLTGGTQLAALLRAGTVTRSQTLIEEIQRAMPRYVQSAAFAEARERLRHERVLVIAGVPGVGKTTLARMLLAEAVLDGYEPIEISRDVEEAWELVDDGTKQVFLYDDFLGRTALAERFSKNEDRRLIDFMRRAARRRSTLFVLTTREYILRQSSQLYERLEQEGIEGRRFLLALTKYSRLDRARIFANHAFHSEQLTPAAKESLLADRAYESIIDHPNYNPRTIEWVTGLSGHHLEDRELARYVDFATESLDHPDRIWKHAFEHEIGEHGRLLIFALATLPPSVELEHLEQAFEELCRVSDLTTAGRAFERALSALDDSLVRTSYDELPYRRNRGIVVRPYDPSVIDFVTDYFRHSPGDVARLAHGAVFFEQIEWLYETAVARRTVPAGTVRRLASGAIRTIDAPGLRTVTVPLSPNSWTERPRGTRDMEARLLVAYRMAQGGPRWKAEMGGWWQETFVARIAQWREGNGEAQSLLELLAETKDADVEHFREAVEAAKRVMRSGWSLTQTGEWMIELRTLFPGAFSATEWADFVDEFATWFESELLSEAEAWSTEEEVDAVESVARKLGVDVDTPVLQEAEDIVRHNIEQREAEIEPDDGWEPSPSAPSGASERREIEVVFARLADES